MNQFGCPHAKDAASMRAGTGGPDPDSTFAVIGTGEEITRQGGCIPDENIDRKWALLTPHVSCTVAAAALIPLHRCRCW
eukprot:COSAG06_NODE_21292_length_762_cov_1.048265_2_plen_79_part_00